MRLSRPDSGQAEVLGVALLLGLLVLGTTAVLALGGSALDQTQSSSRLENAEHGMTLFDSRAAMVALGGSGTQTVSFGSGGGDFRVEEGVGELRVIHVDYDGGVVAGDSNDETLYSGELGSVVYTSGETEIAYQAGGVWRKGDGAARMVSPPEFHYRDATLTLPVVLVSGSGGAGGDGASSVTLREIPGSFDREYPNETANYNGDDAPDRVYDNPVQKGFIRIEVESEYYEGWAEYFRTRTDGQVTVYDDNQTARLDLITVGTLGGFTMESVGQEVPVRGFPTAGHSLSEFEVTLRPDSGQSSNFNNLMWSMWAEEGNKRLELAVRGNGAKCGDDVDVLVYFSDDAGSTYEAWQAPYTVQCSGGEIYLPIEFTDSTTATYDAISGSEKLVYFENDMGTFDDPGTLESDSDHPDIDLEGGTTTRSMGFVVRHYFSEFGSDIGFTIAEGNNAGQCYANDNKNDNCQASSGYIDYPGSGRVVTYLHVTENGVEVEFD